MANETKAMEVQEQEQLPVEQSERLRECPCFIPRSDIVETEDQYLLALDMPGVEEGSIDITLEKNVLTINGQSVQEDPEGYSLAVAEYRVGDYERSFRLTNEINRDEIDAVYQNGVLRLTLPKAEEAKARKISVKVK
jgi:HSP20 family molecular chaperone IbpA